MRYRGIDVRRPHGLVSELDLPDSVIDGIEHLRILAHCPRQLTVQECGAQFRPVDKAAHDRWAARVRRLTRAVAVAPNLGVPLHHGDRWTGDEW